MKKRMDVGSPPCSPVDVISVLLNDLVYRKIVRDFHRQNRNIIKDDLGCYLPHTPAFAIACAADLLPASALMVMSLPTPASSMVSKGSFSRMPCLMYAGMKEPMSSRLKPYVYRGDIV
jgi:hypothetical protein